jgi:hypothetical protein
LQRYPAERAATVGIGRANYTELMTTYAKTMTRSKPSHGSLPWVGENIEPDKGFWVARQIMFEGGTRPTPTNCSAAAHHPSGWEPPKCCSETPSCDGKVEPTVDAERGKDYNHSTFCDLIIAGLVGLRATFGSLLTISPLADPAAIQWFALDNVAYHDHNVSVSWDPAGNMTKAGCKGLCVFVDGHQVAAQPTLVELNVTLPPVRVA